MNPHEHHRQEAPSTLRFAVVTVSDSRTRDTDESGALITDRLRNGGHEVLEHIVLPDEIDEIRGTVNMLARDPEIDVIVTNGGTGVSTRDVSIEAVTPLFGKRLPGFGELLRMLSYETIGAAAFLSRAQAGTIPAPDAVKIVFQLPGSPNACDLAVSDMILPEVTHLFSQANRGMDLAGRRAQSDEERTLKGDDEDDDGEEE